jgi:hypothetical protein
VQAKHRILGRLTFMEAVPLLVRLVSRRTGDKVAIFFHDGTGRNRCRIENRSEQLSVKVPQLFDKSVQKS